MNQLQKQMDVIANNLANSQTTGYKKQKASFAELMYQQHDNQRNQVEEVGRLTPNGIRLGTGAGITQVKTVATQGSFVHTNRLLDFALTAPNQYFKVLAPEGDENTVHYTRDGAFYLSPINDNEVVLVTSEGHQVLDAQNNPITFNHTLNNVQLGQNGQLTLSNDAGTRTTFNIGVAQINKLQSMEKVGDNLLVVPTELNGEQELVTNLEGGLRDQIGLKQHALEQSNVDISEEMTDLIQTQRAYQFQAKAITIADQMQGLINGIR